MPKGKLLWRFRKGSEWYEEKKGTPVTVTEPDAPNDKNLPYKNGVCPDCGQRYGLLKYHKCKEVNQ